jgi:hypothetical protein
MTGRECGERIGAAGDEAEHGPALRVFLGQGKADAARRASDEDLQANCIHTGASGF